MPKEIAARRRQRRLSPLVVALVLAVGGGCAMEPRGLDPLPDGEAAGEAAAGRDAEAGPAPSVMTGGDRGSGLGGTTGVRRTTGHILDTDRDRFLQDSRLQRRERTIKGRIGTIDRQIDTIEIRRQRQLDVERYRRDRPGPREVLLEQERRRLQFERRSVQRDRDRLEFERRVDRSPPDPFTNGGRFAPRSIIQR